MIGVRTITSTAALAALGEQWNRLLQRSDLNTVFLTHDFCSAWWETFHAGRRLHVLVAEAAGQLRGIAPLVIAERRKLGVRHRVVELLGAGQADYSGFIVARDDAAAVTALLSKLYAQPRDWDEAVLDRLPEGSLTLSTARRWLADHARPHHCVPATPCRVIPLCGHEDEVRRRLNQQSTLRKYANRLARLGRCEYRVSAGDPAALPELQAFWQQHIDRWDATLTPSVFLKAPQRDFYRRLWLRLGAKGWLHCAYLALDDQPIAFLFGFDYAETLSLHRSAFAPTFAKYSPGRLVLREAIGHALTAGHQEVDLLSGDEGYKEHLAKASRSTAKLMLFHTPSALRAYLLRGWLKRAVTPRGSGHPSRLRRLQLQLRRTRRRYGVFGGLARALRRGLRPLVAWSLVELFAWRGEPVAIHQPRLPLEIRAGGPADLRLLATFRRFPLESKGTTELSRRLARGDRPYLAFSGNTLVHVAWLCQRDRVEVGELWCHFAFPGGAYYLMGCTTSPLFRGLGIYPAVVQHIIADIEHAHVAEPGACPTLYAACRRSNLPSRRGLTKAGLRHEQTRRGLRLLGRRFGPPTIELSG